MPAVTSPRVVLFPSFPSLPRYTRRGNLFRTSFAAALSLPRNGAF
jgi:hypothetical protein